MHTIVDALTRNASNHKSKIAVSDAENELSFEEVFARAAGLAETFDPQLRTIGLLAESGVIWVIGQLAAVLGGKRLVPIPTFFSREQIGFLARDAGIELVLATEAQAPRLKQSAIGHRILRRHGPMSAIADPKSRFGQLIYTSGSTGAPKGVLHEGDQVEWSATALAQAIEASSADLHLSVLPLPLLLETICAIFVPVLVGARVHFETALSERLATGDASGIADAFAARSPTTSVLVPQLVRQWTQELAGQDRCAPSSLRLVAVGGAALGKANAQAAMDVGIPVFEGYGLSECCSVVAVNTPQARRPGTVGRVLSGLSLRIDHGEIVVDGPSVMDGYLHGPPNSGPWRTGDLGSLDADGYLTIYGRKDNLIVTSTGRNISPEWVESVLAGDPRILASCVFGTEEAYPSVLIIPSSRGTQWVADHGLTSMPQAVTEICAALPAYAVPRRCLVVSFEKAAGQGLFTSNGRLRRDRVRLLAMQPSGV